MANEVFSAQDAERIVTHMNAEHTADIIRYAEVYAGMSNVEDARMTAIDADGFDLAVETDGETTPVRIAFDTPLDSVDDARIRLVELAMEARGDAER